MDLLMSSSPAVDEQHELSTRALRACLAAEAALASLRAECLPLQSSLLWQGEAGSSRNLELAHRSLQLQIDACESFTLCATAAFKQLCDAYFLPSSRIMARAKIVQSNRPSSTQHFTQKLDMEHESRSKASKENVNFKSEMQSHEDTFNSPLRFLPSNDLERPPGDSRKQHMPISRTFSKSRSSTPSESSHKSQFADRSNSSSPETPKEFPRRPDASLSQASTQNSNTPNLFPPPVKELFVGVSQSFSFEAKDRIRTHFEGLQSLPCSSTKDCAEGSGPSPSSLSLKNLIPANFQFSGSETVSARKLQSPHNSTQCLADRPISNQEEITAADHSLPVHRQEEVGTAVCKKSPNSTARLSCVGERTAAPSHNYGYADAPPHSSKAAQSYQFSDGPRLASSTQFRCMESASASVGCRSKHELCSSAAIAATDNAGGSMTPSKPTGCSLGNNSRSFCTQPAASQLLGAEQFQECKNGQFLHLRKNTRASSSDGNLGFASVVDINFDSDNSQAGRSNASQGKLGGEQKGLDSSSPSIGRAPSRGGYIHDVPGTNLNLLFSPPPAAAYESENPRLPRATAAMTGNFGQRFWAGSAFSPAAVTYQMWPYSSTSDAPPNSTSGPSNLATQSFAAAQSLPSFSQSAMQESLKAFEVEARSLPQANDLTNWQVVTRLEAEAPDKSFSSAHNQCHNATKVQIEEKDDTREDKVGKTWFHIPSNLHQTTRGLGVASVVDIDSEDDSEDGEDEDGEEHHYEGIHPR